jgi:predicted metal-dependent TIM-barrel fold hydrolase
LDDDGYGNVRIYKIEGTSKVYINSKIGKINYEKGIVTINNFNPQYIQPKTDSEIKITVQPQKNDIQALRNQIIVVDYNRSNFIVEQDTTQTSDSRSGTPFPY